MAAPVRFPSFMRAAAGEDRPTRAVQRTATVLEVEIPADSLHELAAMQVVLAEMLILKAHRGLRAAAARPMLRPCCWRFLSVGVDRRDCVYIDGLPLVSLRERSTGDGT